MVEKAKELARGRESQHVEEVPHCLSHAKRSLNREDDYLKQNRAEGPSEDV